MAILLQKLRIWLRACRALSFTASLAPVCVGAALTIYYGDKADWLLFPLVIICSLLFHAGANLINDYFDFKTGSDDNTSFGVIHVLTEGILKPNQILYAAWVSFGLGFSLGLFLAAIRGLPMLLLGAIGLIGGYCYTGRPFAFKYIGAGDILVFLLMGPLMVIGSYFALTGIFDSKVLYVSLPVGFLVTAILNSNNIRDIIRDRQINIKTFACILGEKNSKAEYFILVSASFLSIIIMILKGILPPVSLLVFLSLPLGVKNIKKVLNCQTNKPQMLALIDVETAQLQLLFVALLIVSLILARAFWPGT